MPVKPLPHNIEAEQAVLSALLNEPSFRPTAKGALSSDDFYREAHQILFPIITNDTLDLLGIAIEAQKKGLLERCGSRAYLMELAAMMSTPSAIDHYISIIKETARKRRLVQVSMKVIDSAERSTSDEMKRVLSNALQSIDIVDRSDLLPNKILVNKVYDLIGERSRTGDNRVGILTGYENIDSKLHGMAPKTTFYLKAESGTGKSALALNIGENVVSGYDGNVLFFTLESTAVDLTFRRFAIKSRIALTRIRTGNIRSDAEWEDILRVCNELSENNMSILEGSRFRWFEDLQGFCEAYQNENKLLLLIVDFLQLMRSRIRHNSRHLELSYISDCFNFLAKDLNIPILVLSQVNKNYATKESRDIENNADNVWQLQRDNPEAEYAKLTATKGKDSGTWVTWLRFDRFIQRFYDCQEQYEIEH